MKLSITATAYPEDSDSALRAVEVLSRAAVGLALDGMQISISAYPVEEEEE